MGKSIVFGWYGGKYSHLDWLLPLLVKTTHYCEPFGGSAAILINRQPSPVETYNDLDGEVVNFFRVLRDRREALIKAIALTPFSRREFELAISPSSETISDLERARRFFIRARQVRTGLAQTASAGRWAHCLLTSRAGMAGAVSRWLGSIDGLAAVTQRLQRVQIENSPAIEVIQRYDSSETLFYCDPPYPHESRGDRHAYAYEMSDAEHEKLAYILHNVKGNVAISGYDSTIMHQLYGDWHKIVAPAKSCHSTKQLRTEVLWTNYLPPRQAESKGYQTRSRKSVKPLKMLTPEEILNQAWERASKSLSSQEAIASDPAIISQVEYVCRHLQNRSGVRLLLSSLLAKIHKPTIDIRKPYTEIGGSDCYSGRTYDESYITAFINEHQLPCNPTTAFLTPALRSKNITLTPEINLGGRPAAIYKTVLKLLNDVQTNVVSSETLLTETVRWLLIVRNENRQQLQSLLTSLETVREDGIVLSAEAIVNLIQQHLNCRNSSRLPVLIVAAAYQAVSRNLGEQHRPLESHNAADKQTKVLGDIEITLVNEERVITSYEMKMKRVTIDDINRALMKIEEEFQQSGFKIDNYIFITTEMVDRQVEEYAASIYSKTGGIEVVILDCIGFLRHFLHFFHRCRLEFLEAYQKLVLEEPDSAVNQPLKQAFLALRQVAESTDI